jgi:hypothetical protein
LSPPDSATRLKGRARPIPRFLASELSSLIEHKKAEDLVFTTPSGSTLRLPTWRRSAFHPARNKAGFSERAPRS